MKDKKTVIKNITKIIIVIPFACACIYWLFFMVDSFVPREPAYREYYPEDISENYYHVTLLETDQIIGIGCSFEDAFDNKMLIVKDEYLDFHYMHRSSFEHSFTYQGNDVHLTIYAPRHMFFGVNIYATIDMNYQGYILQTSIDTDIEKFFIYDRDALKQEVENDATQICEKMIKIYDNDKEEIEKYLKEYL